MQVTISQPVTNPKDNEEVIFTEKKDYWDVSVKQRQGNSSYTISFHISRDDLKQLAKLS